MIVALLSALWTGILASVSPCPLATNVAAVAYISKNLERPSSVIISGLLYTVGRVFAYASLGAVIVTGLLAVHDISFFLQKHMNMLLGPILLIASLFLLELIRIPLPRCFLPERFEKRALGWGHAGSALLGFLFGLSFCPVSAALFFGVLIPVAIERQSAVAIPALFGIGTGLPVIAFAILLASGFKGIGSLLTNISHVGLWARRITAIIFILLGFYFTIRYTIGFEIK
jgi:cytochrome c biogenesis protein CcdA